MMPTDREDVQLVKKKRHLGNDEVNIIWNEHYRPFDPNAIPSEVTEAYIIVTPLPNKLFGIELNVKREVCLVFISFNLNMTIPKRPSSLAHSSTESSSPNSCLHMSFV